MCVWCVVTSCELEFCSFPASLSGSLSVAERAAAQTLWHSAAHVLGQAIEYQFAARDTLLHDGPALALNASDGGGGGGFFYDVLIRDAPSASASASAGAEIDPNARTYTVSSEDWPQLSALATRIAAQRAPFQRLTVDRDFALRFFAHNPLKLDLIRRLPPQSQLSVGVGCRAAVCVWSECVG